MSAAALLESAVCPLCRREGGAPVDRSPAQMSPSTEVFTFVACEGCGLVRLEPRVPATAVGVWYDRHYLPHRGGEAWGRFAALVESSQEGTDAARLARVLSAGPLGPSSRLLDVGCGRPTFLEHARRRLGLSATGVDFAEDLWAREADRWRGLELVHGTLEALGDRAGFDAVTLWHALEHDYDPVETLKALRERAAPGARLVVEVPDHGAITRKFQGPFWGGYHTPRHTLAFDPASLKAVVEAAGWRVQRQDRWGTLDPWVLWWLGEQERRGHDLRGSLEPLFFRFVLGKVLSAPLVALQRWIPLGVQTLLATRG